MSVHKNNKPCEQCGVIFEYDVRVKSRKFCSRACYKNFMNEIRTPQQEPEAPQVSWWNNLGSYVFSKDILVGFVAMTLAFAGFYCLIFSEIHKTFCYLFIGAGASIYFWWLITDER